MATASNPADYSDLQAVDGRHQDSEGLQPVFPSPRPDHSTLQAVQHHLTHDENDGVEVVHRDDTPNDPEELEPRPQPTRRKRRVCGLPIMVVVGLATLLVIGAVVGGVVGGVVGKKKNNGPSATPSDPNALPLANETTEVPPAATQTGFAFPEQNKWYRIMNENSDLGNAKRALLSIENYFVAVYEPVATDRQYWQFIATDGQRGINGGTYWISNKYRGRSLRLSGMHNRTSVQLLVSNLTEPLQRWYFVQGRGGKSGQWLLKNQAFGKGWNFGYDTADLSKGKMKQEEGEDTHWYVEEVDPKSDTQYLNISTTSSTTAGPTLS